MARRMRTVVAAILVATLSGACSASVAGRAVRGDGQPTTVGGPQSPGAQNLLLKAGDDTPFGPATPIAVGDNYFTSAQPPECQGAVVFENSPLLPPGAAERAESAYRFSGPQTYGESLGIYDASLNAHHVIVEGFIAIGQCFIKHGATGVARDGTSSPLQLQDIDQSSQALVWVMTRPGWNCGYGLGSAPRVVLLVSACDAQPGFPMEDWVYKRLGQISGRIH